VHVLAVLSQPKLLYEVKPFATVYTVIFIVCKVSVDVASICVPCSYSRYLELVEAHRAAARGCCRRAIPAALVRQQVIGEEVWQWAGLDVL
jgi:hypothetical protein